MSNWIPTTLVIIDDITDRERASDGHSRFGAYLDQRPDDFRDWPEDDAPHSDPARFAVAAWTVATAPVMVPEYAIVRPDLRITAHTDQDKGHLYLDITVPLHHQDLRHRIGYPWQDWALDRGGWGSDLEDDYRARTEPEPGRPAILASAVVRVSGADWPLPAQTATRGRQLLTEARDAVSLLADRINAEAGPMVAELLAPRTR